MSEQNIPSGRYDCWAIHHNPEAPEEAPIELPITADKAGCAQVNIRVALAEKGTDEAFAAAEVYQTIDPDEPARGNTETAPYEFAVLCLLALGAESREAIAQALGEAFAAGRATVVIPGLGRVGVKADAKVEYKPSRKAGGEPFMNVQIFARRDVSADKAATLAERFKRMGGGAGAAAPPPFAPRGKPIAPPAATAAK